MTQVTLFGFYVSASLIGNIAALLTNIDADATRLQTRLDALEEYSRSHGLPEVLTRRGQQYLEHIYAVQKGLHGACIWRCALMLR